MRSAWLLTLLAVALSPPAEAQVKLHSAGQAQGYVVTTSADGAAVASVSTRPYAPDQIVPLYQLGTGQDATGRDVVYDLAYQIYPAPALAFSSTVGGARVAGAASNLAVTYGAGVGEALQAPGGPLSQAAVPQSPGALSATRLSATRTLVVFPNASVGVVSLVEFEGAADGSALVARSAAVLALEVATNTNGQIGAGWNGKWVTVGGRTQTAFISYDPATGLGTDRTFVSNPAGGLQYLAAGPGATPNSFWVVLVAGDPAGPRTVSVQALLTASSGAFASPQDPGLSLNASDVVVAAFDAATSNLVLAAYGAATAVRVGTPMAAGLSFVSAGTPLDFRAQTAPPPVSLPPSSSLAYLVGAAGSGGAVSLYKITLATGAVDAVAGTAYGTDAPRTLLWEAAPEPAVSLTLAQGTTGLVPISLSNALARVVVVGYKVTDGANATVGIDYRDCSPTPGTLTFAPGVTLQNICLEALARNCRTQGKFSLALTSNSAGSFVATPVPVTITTDPCSASLQPPALAQGTAGSLLVTLAKLPAIDVTVTYVLADGPNAVNGTDYRDTTVGAGTLVFKGGVDVTKNVSLAALPANCRAAGSFQASVTANSAGPAPDPATVAIAADPCPAAFSQVPSLAPGTTGELQVTLSRLPSVDVRVGYVLVSGPNAEVGVDFQDQTGGASELLFRAGQDQTRGIVILAPARNCRAPGSFLAALTTNSAGGGVPAQPVSIVIAGDACEASFESGDVTLVPDGSTGPVNVRLSKVPGLDVLVTYALADAGQGVPGVDVTDVTPTPGTLTFRSGTSVPVPILLQAAPRGCRSAGLVKAVITSVVPGRPSATASERLVSIAPKGVTTPPPIRLVSAGQPIPADSAVVAGALVAASIDPSDPDPSVTWSVQNGEIQPGGDSHQILVRVPAPGILKVSAVRTACRDSVSEVRLAVLDESRKLLLQGGALAVQVVFLSPYDAAQGGAAVPLAKTDDFGFFTFTDPANPEVVAKGLDFGGTYPVLFGAVSDFELMTVFTLRATGQRKVFTSAPRSYQGGGAKLVPAASAVGPASRERPLTAALPEIRIYVSQPSGELVEDPDAYPVLTVPVSGPAPRRVARIVGLADAAGVVWEVVNGSLMDPQAVPGEAGFEATRPAVLTVRAKLPGLPAGCPGVEGGCIQRKVVAVDDGNVLQLRSGALTVQASWQSPYDPGTGGAAVPLPANDAYGYFHFGDAANPEVLVKGLDFGTSLPVLFGGLTDFEYAVTFVRADNGKRVTFYRPPGAFTGGGDSVTLSPGAP